MALGELKKQQQYTGIKGQDMALGETKETANILGERDKTWHRENLRNSRNLWDMGTRPGSWTTNILVKSVVVVVVGVGGIGYNVLVTSHWGEFKC